MNDWLVGVPEYDEDGVVIRKMEVTAREQLVDEMRAAFNPQRPDRSVKAGMYTQLVVDGVVWMTDTPAEIADLREVDNIMSAFTHKDDSSMLIAGLGLGVVLNRAIVTHGIRMIDVVESDPRVLKAVGPYFQALAEEHGVMLFLHLSDIHAWRPPSMQKWDIGFFDIWATINDEDMAEVTRLRKRFRKRLAWFGSWAQDERIAQRKRIRNKTGWY